MHWQNIKQHQKKDYKKVKDQVMEEHLDEQSILIEKVRAFEELIEVQGNNLGSQYMIGLYNGLVLGKSILTGEEPKFYEQEENENVEG